MPNNFFPALEARGAMPAFYAQQQNERQNQLVGLEQQQAQLQQQAMQQKLAQQQAEDARRQQFNQLIPQLAGLSPTEQQIAGPIGEGGQPGAPQPPDQNALLAQAFQLDPEGTQKFLAVRQQQAAAFAEQQQKQAAESVREAQFVLASKSPKALMETYFPDRVEQIRQAGHDWDGMDDEAVKASAQHILERAAPKAGLSPEKDGGEQFTLGKDQVRFDAKGNPIARGVESTAAEKDPTDKSFTRANKLRDEFTAQGKDFSVIQSGYQNILATAQKPSAAGDIALVTSYMKLLDPQSTVREGEFANAENAGGIPSKLRAQYNKMVNGERLAPEQRADFVSQAGQIFKTQKQRSDKLRSKYSTLAQRARVDPADVVGEDLMAGDEPTTGGAPAVGAVDSGYVFMGGDPSNPQSWKKQ